MKKIKIDKAVSNTLERMSVEQNKSKSSIAVEACKNFLSKGVPHRKSR